MFSLCRLIQQLLCFIDSETKSMELIEMHKTYAERAEEDALCNVVDDI